MWAGRHRDGRYRPYEEYALRRLPCAPPGPSRYAPHSDQFRVGFWLQLGMRLTQHSTVNATLARICPSAPGWHSACSWRVLPSFLGAVAAHVCWRRHGSVICLCRVLLSPAALLPTSSPQNTPVSQSWLVQVDQSGGTFRKGAGNSQIVQ